MIRIALRIVEHGIIAGAVAECEHRPFADLTGNGGRLGGLAAFHGIDGIKRCTEQQHLILAHVILICGYILILAGCDIRYVSRNNVVERDAESFHKGTRRFTLAGRNHPYIKIVVSEEIDHFDHGQVE